MRVGLDVYSIREMDLTAREKLDYAKCLGYEGVQFETLDTLSSTLDLEEIKKIKDYADSLDMYTHVSVPSVNPNIYPDKSEEEVVEGLYEQVKVAAELGWYEVRSHMGILKHRLESTLPWKQHLDDSIRVIKKVIPCLEETGVRLNLETHSDSTSHEILYVIKNTGEKYVGVTLDTGNLLTHGEYPVVAAKRLAPYVHLTHAKDAYLFFDEKGFIRQGCPPGRGVLEWGKIIDILLGVNPKINLSIEDHKKLFIVGFADEEWLKWHPDVNAYELGQLMRLAWSIEQRRQKGEITEIHEYEAVPYVEQAEERLTFGLNYIKDLLVKKGVR